MADKRKKKQTRRGRKATTAAILDAAEELFSARGYSAVAVRDIAERAGVSHPIVHKYVGSKADVLRAVLARDEGLIVSAAPANPDLIESTQPHVAARARAGRPYLPPTCGASGARRPSL